MLYSLCCLPFCAIHRQYNKELHIILAIHCILSTTHSLDFHDCLAKELRLGI